MKSLLLVALTMCSLALSAQTITYKAYRVGDTSSDPTTPWITDGGSCRIGVFVNGKYDHDYDLSINIENGIDLEGKVFENEEQKLAYIANAKKTNIGNDHACPINNDMRLIIRKDNVSFIFVPFVFYVTGDESIVDHYEACCYIHKKNNTFPLLNATDVNGSYTGKKEKDFLYEATETPDLTYDIPVHAPISVNQNAYDAFYMTTNGNIITWAEGLLLQDDGNGDISITVYVKVHFKEETELKPVCYDMHSLKNHINNEQHTVTDIEDLNVDNNIAPVYYDLGGRVVNAEQMGKGIYIKRIGNKSEKVLVR